jgi:hypothetical protein
MSQAEKNDDHDQQEAGKVEDSTTRTENEIVKEKEIENGDSGEGDLKEDNSNGDIGQTNGNQNVAAGWAMNEQANGQMFPFGFGGNQNGFTGMGWSQPGVFNPMMQMQMQNNMGNGNWGYQNMMGSFIHLTSRLCLIVLQECREWA